MLRDTPNEPKGLPGRTEGKEGGAQARRDEDDAEGSADCVRLVLLVVDHLPVYLCRSDRSGNREDTMSRWHSKERQLPCRCYAVQRKHGWSGLSRSNAHCLSIIPEEQKMVEIHFLVLV